MFDTSLDIFYLALAICVVFFTGFVCWAIYYVVQLLKQGNEVVSEVRVKITELEEMVMSIKEKVVSSATSITFIAKEIGSIVEFARGMKSKKNSVDSDE